MSKSLTHILEFSLLPAIILICSKLIGVVIIVWAKGISWNFRNISEDLGASGTSISKEDILSVNSYSDLIMLVAIVSLFSFNLIEAIYLHNTHISPFAVTKLAKLNLMNLVKTTYELYHKAAINILFLWLTTTLIIINVFINRTYTWIGITAFVVSLLLTTMLMCDVWKELEESNKN